MFHKSSRGGGSEKGPTDCQSDKEGGRESDRERGTVPVECLAAIAANTFSMHTITSSKLLAKLKLNYAAAVQGGVAGGWGADTALHR